MANLHAEGASRSINSTIAEIQQFLAGNAIPAASQLRKKLRRALADLGEDRYRAGYRRAHRDCLRHEEREGAVPKRLTNTVRRAVAPGVSRTLHLVSKPKRKRGP